MRGSRWCLFALGWLWLPLAFAGQAADAKKNAADEKLLNAAGIKTDGPALLEFLKARTLSDHDLEQVDFLISQLGASSFKTREQASAALIAKGPAVVESLRQALGHTDAEIQRRSDSCIQKIKERDRWPEAAGAAVPLIGQRKLDGATPALLAYLPFADDENVIEDVRGVLARFAIRDGKADKAIVAALTDKEPRRRGAAGEALVRAGAIADHKAEVKALLADSNAVVRWRVATALVTAKERDAVPVLINLLPDLSQSQAWQVEDVLRSLAQSQAPVIPLGSGAEGRKKFQAAWQTWWQQHGAGVDMAVLDKSPRLLGLTTIVLLDIGKIMEIDGDGNVRWHFEGAEMPLDVQILDNDRVLIAEYNGNRVTERNFKGEILWKRDFGYPQMAQRLPNGNTFIAGKSQLVEIDPAGKQVFAHNIPINDGGIMKCSKLPNGEIVCLLDPGLVVRLDAKGKTINRFPVDFGSPLSGGRLYAQPDGRVLVPFHHHNKVIEYDSNGKVLWQVQVDQPIAATRLANGNTLVTSMGDCRAVEFDPAGKEVWQFRQNTRVTRALRR